MLGGRGPKGVRSELVRAEFRKPTGKAEDIPSAEALSNLKRVLQKDKQSPWSIQSPDEIEDWLKEREIPSDPEAMRALVSERAHDPQRRGEILSVRWAKCGFVLTTAFFLLSMQFYVQAFGRDAFHCNVDGTHKLSWHGWPLIGFGAIQPQHVFLLLCLLLLF